MGEVCVFEVVDGASKKFAGNLHTVLQDGRGRRPRSNGSSGMRDQKSPDANAILASFGVDLDKLEDQRGVRSVPFEPHLCLRQGTEYKEVAQLTNRLVKEWQSSRQRRPGEEKTRQFAACVELILLNLVRAEVRSEGLTVGIGTSKGRLDASRRYHPAFMSVDYFRNAMQLLQVHGIMYVAAPGYQNDGLAQVARYAFADSTKRILLRDAPPLNAFAISNATEAIVLKDTKGQLAKYVDTEDTRAMRKAVTRINKVNVAAHISSTRPPNPEFDLEEAPATNSTRLHRIFNNGTFDQGGRFYGGWWQLAKKHFRPLITINGEPTVEADYKGLHASMLFAKNRLPIPEDPYALVPGVLGNPTLRKHAKTTLMALLNAGRQGTAEPREFDSDLHEMSAEQFRQVVRDAFPMLPGIFGSGAGLYLQREDSDLAEAVMLHFVDQGIPILPVHDSFIVAQRHRDELVQVMADTFKQFYGQEISISIK